MTVQNSTSWFHSETFQSDIPDKISLFAQLPQGWHNGSGGPIAPIVIRRAQQIHSYLLSSGFSHTNAFPGRGGDVLLTAYDGPRYIGITVEPDGTYSLNHENDKVEIDYLENVTEADIRATLRRIVRSIWSTSASYIQGTSIMSLENSTTWHLRNTAADSRFSMQPVQSEQAAGFVLI